MHKVNSENLATLPQMIFKSAPISIIGHVFNHHPRAIISVLLIPISCVVRMVSGSFIVIIIIAITSTSAS